MRRSFALIAGVVMALSLGAAGVAGVTRTAKATQPAQAVWQRGTEESGVVERTETTVRYLDGKRQATFRYPGAEYVKLHFTRLTLLPGDYVTVSVPGGAETHRYTGANAGAWAMSVSGDTAQLVLHTRGADPLGLRATIESLGVTVDKVARGFTRAERAVRAEASQARKRQLTADAARRTGVSGREESVCGADTKADAVCYRTTDPVAYRRSKAVARLLINGTELCTAWRVGADNRLLTNHHCIENSDQARETEVWFNYQCAECGGYEVFRPTKVWAGEVLATDKTLDFTLFTVEEFELVQHYGYLQLDVRAPVAGERLYVPQHPSGAPAAIATDRGNGNCAVVDPSYDGYAADTDMSYYCDTEGGSSGSPVLARSTNRVIALHHFGGCPNSGVRVDRIYPAIADLL